MRHNFVFYSIFLIMLCAGMVFVHTLISATVSDPENIQVASASSIASSTIASSTMNASSSALYLTYPSELIIPTLNIAAHIQDVGLNKEGAMRTPDNFTDVAWYEAGVIPGNVGSAVIDGHVDNGLGFAAVFKNLATINIGADIYIEATGGGEVHYTVTSINTYDYNLLPLKDIFNSQNGSQLRLITCAGTWIPAKDMYDKRLVVTAVLQAVSQQSSQSSLIN